MKKVKTFYNKSLHILEIEINKFLLQLDDNGLGDSSHDADIQFQSDDDGFSALISYLEFPDDEDEE